MIKTYRKLWIYRIKAKVNCINNHKIYRYNLLSIKEIHNFILVKKVKTKSKISTELEMEIGITIGLRKVE